MAKKQARSELWEEEPEDQDFPAAAEYLTLLLSESESASIVDALRAASIVKRKAKDLMRASGLPLLPSDDPEVAKELKRVRKGELLSPVLLVRGRAAAGVALIVADGYHRICASYHLNEAAEIPCRIAGLP